MNLRRIAFSVVLLAAFCLPSSARGEGRPAEYGFTSSYKGYGLYSDYKFNEDGGWDSIMLVADFFSIYQYGSEHPGAYLHWNHNYVLRNMKDSEGFDIQLFAGPGIVVGYVADYNEAGMGGMFGLCGIAGIRTYFRPRLSIVFQWSATLGMHIHAEDSFPVAQYFRNGIIAAWVPTIKVGYAF